MGGGRLGAASGGQTKTADVHQRREQLVTTAKVAIMARTK
jgi:hypothetical protein